MQSRGCPHANYVRPEDEHAGNLQVTIIDGGRHVEVMGWCLDCDRPVILVYRVAEILDYHPPASACPILEFRPPQ